MTASKFRPGDRVVLTEAAKPQFKHHENKAGTVTSSSELGPYVRVRFDGNKSAGSRWWDGFFQLEKAESRTA